MKVKENCGSHKYWQIQNESSFFSFMCQIGLKPASGGIFSFLTHYKGKPQSQLTYLRFARKCPCMRWSLPTCPASPSTGFLLIGNIELLIWQPTLYHKHTHVYTHVHKCYVFALCSFLPLCCSLNPEHSSYFSSPD